MAIQKVVLTREITASVDGGAKTLKGKVGTLAIGKVGDIVTRAYGPVVRSGTVDVATDLGTYVEGKGILVNGNDIAGISTTVATPFDTKKVQPGQACSFLVSGATIVPFAQVATISAKMNVQFIDATYDAEKATELANDVFEIEVNGFAPAAA